MADLAEVIAYIQEARAVGIPEGDISRELRIAGWQEDAIQEALGASTDAHHRTHRAVNYPGSENIIEVRGLSKRYPALVAVDNITFHVRRGEVFGILGPNGAGKTTTLEMIEGLKTISSGTVTVDGKDVATQTNAVKHVIGVQLQSSGFFEALKLTELLDVFASMYGRKVNAMELLAEVQLTEKAGVQVKELSGGQKQRFSIAVGLVNQPKVLFLDEPTTGLDPQARHNLWELVQQIKARGTTVVLTTHYMEEAEVLCDRIAIMDHAHIVAMDTVPNLMKAANAKNMEEVFLTLTGHELRD